MVVNKFQTSGNIVATTDETGFNGRENNGSADFEVIISSKEAANSIYSL